MKHIQDWRESDRADGQGGILMTGIPPEGYKVGSAGTLVPIDPSVTPPYLTASQRRIIQQALDGKVLTSDEARDAMKNIIVDWNRIQRDNVPPPPPALHAPGGIAMMQVRAVYGEDARSTNSVPLWFWGAMAGLGIDAVLTILWMIAHSGSKF